MGCTERSFLIVINGVFIIFSLGLTFFGVWILTDASSLAKLNLDSSFATYKNAYGIASIVSGILSTAIHLMGLWGAYKGISLMLKIYAGILIFAVVGGLIHAIGGLLQLDTKSVTKLEPLFTSNTRDAQAVESMHSLQTMFECCGYKGPKDVHTSDGYPWSCCGSEKGICPVPKYEEGCLKKIKKSVTNHVITSFLVRVAVSVVYGFCIFAALRLASKVSKNGAKNIPFVQFS